MTIDCKNIMMKKERSNIGDNQIIMKKQAAALREPPRPCLSCLEPLERESRAHWIAKTALYLAVFTLESRLVRFWKGLKLATGRLTSTRLHVIIGFKANCRIGTSILARVRCRYDFDGEYRIHASKKRQRAASFISSFCFVIILLYWS